MRCIFWGTVCGNPRYSSMLRWAVLGLGLGLGFLVGARACDWHNKLFLLGRGHSRKIECPVSSPDEWYIENYQTFGVQQNVRESPLQVYVTSGDECDMTFPELLDRGVHEDQLLEGEYPTFSRRRCDSGRCCVFLRCSPRSWALCEGTYMYRTETRATLTQSLVQCTYNNTAVSVWGGETVHVNCSLGTSDEPRVANVVVQERSRALGRVQYASQQSTEWVELYNGDRVRYVQQPCDPGTGCGLRLECQASNHTCNFHIDGSIQTYSRFMASDTQRMQSHWSPTGDDDDDGNCRSGCRMSIRLIAIAVGGVVYGLLYMVYACCCRRKRHIVR